MTGSTPKAEPFRSPFMDPAVRGRGCGDSVKRFRVVTGSLAMGACLFAGSAAAEPEASVTAGCVGGISGGSFGVTIRRGGEIVRWHTSSRHEEPEEFPLESNLESTAALFGELDAIGFEQIDYQEKGDMTCSLSSGGGSNATHRVSWPIGDSEAPAKVTALARRIRALLDDASTSGTVSIE